MKTIDTGITAQQLFEEVLAENDPAPWYDPDKHLDPKVAAERWGISRKAAHDKLKANAKLRCIQVRSPETKRVFDAFVPA